MLEFIVQNVKEKEKSWKKNLDAKFVKGKKSLNRKKI